MEPDKFSTGKSDIEVDLPPPLDKPMDERIIPYVTSWDDAARITNELIDRHNALLEIVKALALRS